MFIKNEKGNYNIFIIAMIFLFPLVYNIQGIDFTDTGFALTYFQQIFNDPSSISYFFNIWLTNIIGGVWNSLFGWGGLLSFKIAAVLVSWLIAFFVYRIYSDFFINKTFLLLGILFGLVFYYSARISVIYYNNISMLFLSLAALFMIKGIDKKSRLLLFCAGSAIALTAFARISNILSLSFILVILFDVIIEKKRFSVFFIDCVFVFIGFLASSVLVFIIMSTLGHFNIYIDSLKELFLSPSKSDYTMAEIIVRFCNDWGRALTGAILFFPISVLAVFLKKKIKPLPYKVFSVVLLLAVFLFTWIMRPRIASFILISIGIIAITCILILTLAGNEHKNQKKLALLTILLLSVLSVGSNTGITVGCYGIIFGFPLVFWFWNEMPPVFIDINARKESETVIKTHVSFDYATKRKIIGFFICFYIVLSIPFVFRYIYRDSSQRWKMNTLVNHNMLRGVFTTPQRASAIESLVLELGKYVKENDYLLTYDAIPMTYFLTKTRPYLYNSWPSLYSPSELKKSIDKAQKEHDYLPVAVIAKVLFYQDSWPNSEAVSLDEKQMILSNFLEENKYQVIWENNVFKILLPPKD